MQLRRTLRHSSNVIVGLLQTGGIIKLVATEMTTEAAAIRVGIMAQSLRAYGFRPDQGAIPQQRQYYQLDLPVPQ